MYRHSLNRSVPRIGVLLGGGIKKNGRLPKDALSRAKEAIKAFKSGEIDYIVCSGKTSYGEPDTTEARAYRRLLVDAGLPADKLLVEERSRDTIGNAIYTKKLINKFFGPIDPEIKVITSDYHMKRALSVFRHIFGESYEIEGLSSHPHLLHRIRRFLREFEIRAAEKILLATVPVGDHEAALELIKAHLPMYRHH